MLFMEKQFEMLILIIDDLIYFRNFIHFLGNILLFSDNQKEFSIFEYAELLTFHYVAFIFLI